MQKIILLGLTVLTMSNCSTVTSPEAICAGTEAARDAHVAALIDHGETLISTGGGEVLVTGNTLIQALDKGCGT